MKKQLHITIGSESDARAQAVIEKEKQAGLVATEVVSLTPETAPQVLEKIFAADSICVWPPAEGSS